MSCDSPFEIPLTSTTLLFFDYDVTFKGSISISGETIDDATICVPTYKLPELYCPKSSKEYCVDWGLKCKDVIYCKYGCKEKACLDPAYKSGSFGWGECAKENIQLYPNLNISYSAKIPMTFEMGQEYAITVDTPTSGIETASLEVKEFDLEMDINGTTVPIKFDKKITFYYSQPGGWSATLDLTGVEVSTVIKDLKYDLHLTFYLLFCALPENGMSWFNLGVDADLTVINDGETQYEQTFSVACPITDVAE